MKKIFTMMVVFAASVASAFAEVWTPEYNDNMEATVPFSALKVDGGIKIEQEKEGAIKVTSDGTGGKLAIELPDEGIDISNGFVVTFTGDDGIFSRLELSSKDNGSLGGLYNSKYVYNATTDNSRIGKLRHVNKMEWIGPKTNTVSTMVITSIVIKKLFQLAADEVNLTPSMFRDWTHWDNLIDNGATYCPNAIGEKLKAGDLLYGNGSVWGKTFADLTGYQAMRIYASKGDEFRILMNRRSDKDEDKSTQAIVITADESGVATLDISTDGNFHLNAIKLHWNGRENVTVKAIALVYGDSPVFSETSLWNPISKATRQPKVTRNLVAGLNTICLPFKVDASQFGLVFGDADAKAYQFKGVEGYKLCFEEATSIEAGVPYLLKVAKAYKMSNVGKVDILVEEPKAVVKDGVTFKGTFNVKVLDENNLFLGKGGKLKVPASTKDDNNKLKGMRAFFVLPEKATQAAHSLSFGGGTTGILAIEGEKAVKDQGVYTISGVKVADNTAKLSKGLYIVNGKKFIKK